jgi:hypothetical protein
MHRALVEWTRAQGTAGRLLIYEHVPLAVRAVTLSHRGRLGDLVGHRRHARGERSVPASAGLASTLNRAVFSPDHPALEAMTSGRVGSGLACCTPPGGAAERLTPEATNEALLLGRASAINCGRGSGRLATPALSSWDVAVHGLVLPAVLPLVVSRELGAAPPLGADTVACVLPVRSRKRADRCAPVPLLCHVRSHPFGRDRRMGGSGGPALHVVRTAIGTGSFRMVNIV